MLDAATALCATLVITEEGNCCNHDFCRLLPSPWRAAIRVLQKSAHPIFQKWLQAALLANECQEHIGWGPEPRHDAQTISYTCHNKPLTQTLAKSQWSLYCNQTFQSCKPASQSAIPKSQVEHPFQPGQMHTRTQGSAFTSTCTDADLEQSLLAELIIRVGRPSGQLNTHSLLSSMSAATADMHHSPS